MQGIWTIGSTTANVRWQRANDARVNEAKLMEVILLDKVIGLGQLGDKANVKPGYARNFLIPQGKAVRATKANLERFEAERAELERKQAERIPLRKSAQMRLPV